MKNKMKDIEGTVKVLSQDIKAKDNEIDELRKENKKKSEAIMNNFVYHQKIEKDKFDLTEQIRRNEKQIHELKINGVCMNGCQRYNKSMDEVVKYASKHREGLIELKKVSENQRSKISSLRDQKEGLQNKIDELRHDMEIEKDSSAKVRQENFALLEKVSELKKELIVKDDFDSIEKKNIVIKPESLDVKNVKEELSTIKGQYNVLEKELNISKMNSLKQNNNLESLQSEKNVLELDLIDKSSIISELNLEINNLKENIIVMKDEREESFEKISNLENVLSKQKEEIVLKCSQTSLEEELNLANKTSENDELAEKFKYQEIELVLVKENEIKLCEQIDRLLKFKEKKNASLGHLKELEIERNKTLKELETSIQNLKQKNNTSGIRRCKFGWFCNRRLVCKFDHSFLTKKVNMPAKFKTSPPSPTSSPLCDKCGEMFGTKQEFINHFENFHMITKQFKDENCPRILSCQTNFNEQIHQLQQLNEIQCSKCGKCFISKEVFKKHDYDEHFEKNAEITKSLNDLTNGEFEQVEKKEKLKENVGMQKNEVAKKTPKVKVKKQKQNYEKEFEVENENENKIDNFDGIRVSDVTETPSETDCSDQDSESSYSSESSNSEISEAENGEVCYE